jgi:hypothetical protein
VGPAQKMFSCLCHPLRTDTSLASACGRIPPSDMCFFKKPCPYCQSTERLMQSEWAPTHLDRATWICDNPPCVYQRTKAKSERVIQREATRTLRSA